MDGTITGAITDSAKLPKVAFPRIAGRADGGETVKLYKPPLYRICSDDCKMRSQTKTELESNIVVRIEGTPHGDQSTGA